MNLIILIAAAVLSHAQEQPARNCINGSARSNIGEYMSVFCDEKRPTIVPNHVISTTGFARTDSDQKLCWVTADGQSIFQTAVCKEKPKR